MIQSKFCEISRLPCKVRAKMHSYEDDLKVWF